MTNKQPRDDDGEELAVQYVAENKVFLDSCHHQVNRHKAYVAGFKAGQLHPRATKIDPEDSATWPPTGVRVQLLLNRGKWTEDSFKTAEERNSWLTSDSCLWSHWSPLPAVRGKG